MNVQQADPPWGEEPFRERNPNLDPEQGGGPDLDAGGSVEPGRTGSERRSLPVPAVVFGLIAVLVLSGLFFLASGVGLFS